MQSTHYTMTVSIFNYHLTVIIRHNLVLKPDTLQSFSTKYIAYFQQYSYLCCLTPRSQQPLHPGLNIVDIRV